MSGIDFSDMDLSKHNNTSFETIDFKAQHEKDKEQFAILFQNCTGELAHVYSKYMNSALRMLNFQNEELSHLRHLEALVRTDAVTKENVTEILNNLEVMRSKFLAEIAKLREAQADQR